MKKLNQKGAILGIVLIFMLIFTLMGFGLLNLSAVDAVEVVKAVQSTQAFWAAEAGLEKAKWHLKIDKSWNNSLDDSFGNGSYIVILENAGSDEVTIKSTGTINNQDRAVEVTIDFSWPEEILNYAVFTDSDDKLVLRGEWWHRVYGDVYAPEGVNEGWRVTGEVDPDGQGLPDYSFTPLDTTYYNAMINKSALPEGYIFINGNHTRKKDFSLNDNTYYIDGNLTITTKSRKPVTINGPGTIVVNGKTSIYRKRRGGKITIGNDDVIGNDVTIISNGKLSVGKTADLRKSIKINGTLYSNQKVEVNKDSWNIPNVRITGNILSDGGIQIGEDVSVKGLIYANGEIKLDAGTSWWDWSEVKGSIVGNSFSDIRRFVLSMSSSFFNNNKPPSGIFRCKEWEES